MLFGSKGILGGAIGADVPIGRGPCGRGRTDEAPFLSWVSVEGIEGDDELFVCDSGPARNRANRCANTSSAVDWPGVDCR